MSETLHGHRERKKQRTHEAIASSALRLFAERGYEATTLAEIAEAAGVSTRTIFAYFPTKEDILFCGFDELHDALVAALEERPVGQDALGTLRDFIVSVHASKCELDYQLARVIDDDETLRSHKRARLAELLEPLADAIARDLGAEPGDWRAQVAAASVGAAFDVLERDEATSLVAVAGDDVAATIDPIISFVRAGLAALPDAG